ncbi:VCBS repeat-containing protein [Candidatus Cyanaurora vandensis]|uniref:FG-GAP repeat domain-containing protein n=2 Tax=Candidatus Cyanaurora vandensis TaxID=2714958 RepID=UPI00257DDE7C|nr:VCBS repeat-containing protein [Candidatus Cyanaurora vandensis]
MVTTHLNLVTLLGLIGALGAVQAQPVPRNYSVGDGPQAIVAGDFDGDGDQDLATANALSDNISILDNLGNTAVGSPRNFALPDNSSPSELVTGDVDGDLDLDLVVIGNTTNLFNQIPYLLSNQGDGTFASATSINAGKTSRIESFAIGDLDGDGDLDLALGTSYELVILKNSGNGTFVRTQEQATPALAFGLVAGDLDGDGDLDLATAETIFYYSNVSIFKNDGTGNFGRPQVRDLRGRYPKSITAGDLDGDGDLDLVVGNRDFLRSTVTVLENNGDATFGPNRFFTNKGQSADVEVGDLDGDGYLDVVTILEDRSTGTVLANQGNGQLLAPVTFSVGDEPLGVVVADLNGDGQVDVATANSGSDNVTILLNP